MTGFPEMTLLSVLRYRSKKRHTNASEYKEVGAL